MKSIKPVGITKFVEETARSLSVSETAIWAVGIAAGLLLLFAIGVVFQVMLISREKKLSVKSTLAHIGNAFWALPVLAVLAFFAFRVVSAGQALEGTRAGKRSVAIDAETTDADDKSVELTFHPTDKAAGWTEYTPVRGGPDGELQSIILAARGAHAADAERKLAKQTRDLLAKEFPREFGNLDFGRLDAVMLKRHIVKQTEEQRGVETVGNYRNDASKVYWQLDLASKNRAELREAVVAPRLWVLGGAFGLIAVVLAAVAGYFRLDARTEGRYRFRLKLATMSLIVGVGLVVTAVLPLV